MQRPAIAGVWVMVVLSAALGGCAQEEPLPKQGPAEHGGRAYALAAAPEPSARTETHETIAERVRAELARDPVIGNLVINVRGAGGQVHLRGFVVSSVQKARAGEIAQSVRGVTRVDNALITRAPSGAAQGPVAESPLYL